MRERRGPALVHAHVTRPYSHSLSDDERLYKTPDERTAEALRDPIVRLGALLTLSGLATEAELKAMTSEIDRELTDAAERAVRAERPTADTVGLYVFSPDVDPTSAAFATEAVPDGKPDTMVAAINRTLKDEMARDPRIVVFGEDVADCSRADALSTRVGQGRRVQGHARPAARLRQRPRVQLAAGRGGDHRPRRAAWRRAASSRSSRSSSSTTSGRR